MLITRNQPSWEYLHHGNQQKLKTLGLIYYFIDCLSLKGDEENVNMADETFLKSVSYL